MSSDGHALTGKIIDHGIVNANVSSAEYGEKKSHEDTSEMTPSVSTHKLDANQLAAKILRLRMKGKHEEADQLKASLATITDPDTPHLV
jgi:precorrin-6x reductase